MKNQPIHFLEDTQVNFMIFLDRFHPPHLFSSVNTFTNINLSHRYENIMEGSHNIFLKQPVTAGPASHSLQALDGVVRLAKGDQTYAEAPEVKMRSSGWVPIQYH